MEPEPGEKLLSLLRSLLHFWSTVWAVPNCVVLGWCSDTDTAPVEPLEFTVVVVTPNHFSKRDSLTETV